MDSFDIVKDLCIRQTKHPSLEGLPKAAQINNTRVYIGEAGAAQDVYFLQQNNISAILSLGTGKVAPENCSSIEIDILDLETELILYEFPKCFAFIDANIAYTSILVHCVYGQSRSAAIIIGYLMKSRGLTLLQAYEIVASTRPCIHVNAGFLMQLSIFEQMNTDINFQSTTKAHAEFRAMIVASNREKNRYSDELLTVIQENLPQIQSSNIAISCRKCQFVYAHEHNIRSSVCKNSSLFNLTSNILLLEPMPWMLATSEFVFKDKGKLLCPTCNTKLGAWDWKTRLCQCHALYSPIIHVVKSRVDLKRVFNR